MSEFIEITSLTFEPNLQIRERLNKTAVEDFARCMNTEDDLKRFAPIEVFFDGTYNWLADGHHRVEAAKKRGHTKIWATVKRGTLDDAIWAAVIANAKQGLALTKADKKRAIIIIIKRWPDKSTRVIADAVAVSHQTVIRLKNQVVQMDHLKPTKKTVGKDGKSYPAKQKPREPSKKAPKQKQPSDLFEELDETPQNEDATTQKTEIAPIWKNTKTNQTYCCGALFEPDPDDDVFDWITEEEREELRKMQVGCPNKLVPPIRNYTIQNIPEHKPDQLLACLFSLFSVAYRKKLFTELARKMFRQDGDKLTRELVTELYNEFNQ